MIVRIFFFCLFIIGYGNRCLGQSASISYIEAEAAAQQILGNGADLVPGSVVFSGVQDVSGNFQMGSFNVTNFNALPSGVIFSTGNAGAAAKKNTSTAFNGFSSTLGTGGDQDLSAISGGGTDAVSLEFSFIPNGNVMTFSYVFASDEYTDYVLEGYNDIFGIFMSGPTFSGSFSNNSENIALIPGTGQAVGVSTLNHLTGNHPNLYNDSTLTKSFLEFDGYTDVLSYTFNVNCGEIYHIKIAIQDGGRDSYYDSWVIVKGGSLSSPFIVDQIQAVPDGPFCEGAPMTLSVNYDANYTYLWNTGATTSSITVNSSQVDNPYNVQVSDNNGCDVTRWKELDIYTQQNEPPILSGINGADNNDCIKANVGQEVCFTVNATDQQNNEKISFQSIVPSSDVSIYFPTGFDLDDKVKNPTYQICWTPNIDDVGVNTFSMQVKDNNACLEMSTSRNYCVQVICPNCPTNWNIKYQNRSVAVNNPLPAKTKTPVSIETGASIIPGDPTGPVVVGNGEEVLFKAGEWIDLNDFSTEPGAVFDAKIEPNTCIDMEEDCNCCLNWAGFRIDIPNVFTPDGDGINDVFTFGDPDYQNCLFRVCL